MSDEILEVNVFKVLSSGTSGVVTPETRVLRIFLGYELISSRLVKSL